MDSVFRSIGVTNDTLEVTDGDFDRTISARNSALDYLAATKSRRVDEIAAILDGQSALMRDWNRELTEIVAASEGYIEANSGKLCSNREG